VIRRPIPRADRRLQHGQQQLIAQQMRSFFAPWSLFPAPLSNPAATGGRNTALTAQSAFNVQATDSAVIPLVGGQLTWYYKTRFKYPPNVTATAVKSDGTPHELYLAGQGTNIACLINSTDTSDTRLVNLHAVGTPI
jgi:hypothetical protein